MNDGYMKYEDIKEFLLNNMDVYVDFEEYDNRGRPILQLENYPLHTHIDENELMDKHQIENFYGTDESLDYRSLSKYPYLRLILEDEDNLRFYVLELNKVFFDSGYQKIKLRSYDNTQLGNETLPWV